MAATSLSFDFLGTDCKPSMLLKILLTDFSDSSFPLWLENAVNLFWEVVHKRSSRANFSPYINRALKPCEGHGGSLVASRGSFIIESVLSAQSGVSMLDDVTRGTLVSPPCVPPPRRPNETKGNKLRVGFVYIFSSLSAMWRARVHRICLLVTLQPPGQ